MSGQPARSARAGSELLAERVSPRPLPSWRDLLFRIYLAALFGPLAALALSEVTAAAALAAGLQLPLQAVHLRAGVGTALAGIALAAALAALSTATWLGPVVFSHADVRFLLAAPLPRRLLLNPRLQRALLRGCSWGVVLGAVLGVVSAQALGGALLPTAGVGALAGSAYGTLLQAGSWAVVASGRSAVVLRTLTWAAPVVVAGCLAATVSPAGAALLRWSGPWGWFAAALVAAADGAPAAASAAVALLTAVAGAAAGWTFRGRRQPATEELARRAGAAADAAAALFLADAAWLLDIRAEALDALRPRSERRLPAPRGARWAIAWRDATLLVRSPARLLGALAAGAAAGAAVVLAADLLHGGEGPPSDAAAGRALLLAVAGVVLLRLAVRRLLAPARSALAWPFGHLHLPWAPEALMRRHCELPAAGAAAAGLAGALAPVALGVLSGPAWTPAWLPALAAVVLAAPALTLAEAAALQAPPEDPVERAQALVDETSAMARSLRRLLARWPVAVASAPVLLAPLLPGDRAASLLIAVAGTAAAGLVAAWRLRRTRPPWAHEEAA